MVVVFFILAIASISLIFLVQSERRTYRSPAGPKINPGVRNTRLFFITISENCSEP